MSRGPISSAGELVCRRPLEKTVTGFVPGQHEVRIIDPRPRRDVSDLAAVLTYVDIEGRACSVTCERRRDDGSWHALTLHRANLRKIERTTAVGVPDLTGGELLAELERAAADAQPFAFVPPSAEERQVRRLAHTILDDIERKRGTAAS